MEMRRTERVDSEDKGGFMRDVGYGHVKAEQRPSSCEPSNVDHLRRTCSNRAVLGECCVESAL